MTTESVIQEKLMEAYQPIHLEVVNESHMHNVPEGSESHFKVVLVSEAFEPLSRVKRHQAVYHTLSAELQGEVHALAIHTLSPKEWQASASTPDSPQCLGGSKAG